MKPLKFVIWFLLSLCWMSGCKCSNQPAISKDILIREGSPGGIPNLGGTCYMNCVLQILKAFYLPKINEKNDKLAKSLQALMKVIQDDKEVANKAEAKAVFEALVPTFNWTSDYMLGGNTTILLEHFLNWMALPTASIKSRFFHPITREKITVVNSTWHIYSIYRGNNQLRSIQEIFDYTLQQETLTNLVIYKGVFITNIIRKKN